MSDLIDTTEMYLRTIYELDEEGVRPMRARIAERLGQSGPTVSQTVARMQRDGLVELDSADRHLVLTPTGAARAVRVMRKHRLAECLLVEVIGLPWEQVHNEACRWEHVMSESVEHRLVELLGGPTISPFGNPIPGLDELSGGALGETGDPVALPGETLTAILADGAEHELEIMRIGESLQTDEELMAILDAAGAVPGGLVRATAVGEQVRLSAGERAVELHGAQAALIVAAAV